jgi:hypothetical protein
MEALELVMGFCFYSILFPYFEILISWASFWGAALLPVLTYVEVSVGILRKIHNLIERIKMATAEMAATLESIMMMKNIAHSYLNYTGSTIQYILDNDHQFGIRMVLSSDDLR